MSGSSCKNIYNSSIGVQSDEIDLSDVLSGKPMYLLVTVKSKGFFIVTVVCFWQQLCIIFMLQFVTEENQPLQNRLNLFCVQQSYIATRKYFFRFGQPFEIGQGRTQSVRTSGTLLMQDIITKTWQGSFVSHLILKRIKTRQFWVSLGICIIFF